MTYLEEIFGLQAAIAVVEQRNIATGTWKRSRPDALGSPRGSSARCCFWLRARLAGHNLLVDGGRTVI